MLFDYDYFHHFLESSPEPQCGAIIEKYKDRFLTCIDARAIAKKLEIEEVIPNRLSFKIENSAPEDANDLLFLHLQSHSSLETLHKLCDVMTSMSGYPNMNKLGSTMKKDLPSVGYVAVTVYKVEQYVHHKHVCVCVYKVDVQHIHVL